jgi:lipid-A-disaccharide synthase-like uncharacterized protein
MNLAEWTGMSQTEQIWVCVGLLGQIAFMMRFVVQWITSERRGESVIPIAFWFFSLGGSLILLCYAIHIRSLPFALGQSFGFIVYIRNLMLINKNKAAA